MPAMPDTLAALQWGHGREAMDGRPSRPTTASACSFNGAMAVRPWMGAEEPRGKRSRQSFNGAMAVRPWMGVGASNG